MALSPAGRGSVGSIPTQPDSGSVRLQPSAVGVVGGGRVGQWVWRLVV